MKEFKVYRFCRGSDLRILNDYLIFEKVSTIAHDYKGVKVSRKSKTRYTKLEGTLSDVKIYELSFV